MRLNKNPYPQNLFEDIKARYKDEINIPEDIDLHAMYKEIAKDHYEYVKLIILRYEEYSTYARIAKKLNFSPYYIPQLHRKTLHAIYLYIARLSIKNNTGEYDKIWLLPSNVRIALFRNDIDSIKQLEQMTRDEVSNLKNIGRVKLKKISDFLRENGTYFKKK